MICIDKIRVEIGDRLQIIIEWAREYRAYMHRECYVCHKKVPKGEGYISPFSFRIIHEECFDKN